MDFWQLKEKLLQAKNKSIDVFNKTVEKWTGKLIESNLTIKTLFDLDNFISKSKNVYNPQTWQDSVKKVICIFASKESDFFKKSLYILPVIFTKWWTSNISVKLVDSSLEWLDLKKFEVETLPSLVLIENEKVIKVVAWEEKIDKIVTWLTLDIEKSLSEKKEESVSKDSTIDDKSQEDKK